MREIIERLEQGLRAWECYNQLREWIMRYGAFKGRMSSVLPLYVKNWRELRRFLLKSKPNLSGIVLPEVDQRFLEPEDLKTEQYSFLDLIVESLVAWNQCRRVYQLSRQAQAFLQLVDFERIRWEDLIFPFPAFAITLDSPLVSEKGEKYDCAVFHTWTTEEGLHLRITALSQRVADMAHFYSRFSVEVERLGLKKNWVGMQRIFNHFYERLQDVDQDQRFVATVVRKGALRLQPADDVGYFLRTTEENALKAGPVGPRVAPVLDEFARIAIALIAYETARPNLVPSPRKPTGPPVGKNHPGSVRSITDEAEICSIGTIIEYTSAQLEVVTKDPIRARKQLTCPGYRKSHSRRPPGKGHDPTAAKTVKVRWTIVRPDLLEEGQLPVGAKTMID